MQVQKDGGRLTSDLEVSIRWHLHSGYRKERTVEILESRGATKEIVEEIFQNMEKERAELARKGRESK
ncbi:hypothetical protein EHO98_22960 [Leptospira stimsonii]|uniref:Uncharacterized protein n=1 Tax=Leptospira stimsonii TaxID=2202203 RepID=A0ABY2N9H7_9LEPT|nr:hypothetical protein EHO98_22960 [Leptospira stimsonii]TGM18742.1 hypothetical protein EHQ90_06640 [Leptospira stimsonii]